MNREIDFENLEEQIKTVLSEGFSGVKILRVNVDDDVDMEGEDILRVEVIFQGRVKDLKPSFLTGAIRRVRPVLSKQHLYAFPMMSFISDADAKVAARA